MRQPWYKPRVFRSFLLLALTAALAACSTPSAPPDTAVVVPDLPASWHAPSPADTPADTLSGTAWKGFADPLLPQLVDEALAANLDLRSAAAALARARALRDLAAASQGLQLGSGASAARNRNAAGSGNTLRLGLDASWEADVFGANAAATAAAQADADAAAATLRATRLQVAAETALAYVQWQGVRQQLRVAEASLASQQQTLALVQARLKAGLAGTLELETATATLEQTGARVPALRQTLTQAEHALAVLLGLPPAALGPRLAAAPLSLPLVPELPAVGVPAQLLQRRPDLRAAERKAASALATLSQQQAARKPGFTLSGSLALQAATLSGLGGSGALLAGVASAVNWTLLDGGAGEARVAAQQAALDSARITWQAAVLAALQDVEDSLSALATGRERVVALLRASASADEALALARHRWQAGLVDYGTLLDAERTALSAADSLASARTDAASSHIRLLKALGGGIGITPEQP